MNLVTILESNTRKSPEKDCLRANGQGYSYLTVKNMAVKTAGLLQYMGIGNGDRIAIMSQNTVSFVVALYGSYGSGVLYPSITNSCPGGGLHSLSQRNEDFSFRWISRWCGQ